MAKIRINMTLESDLDAELYGYLINIGPRRRATLLRSLALLGLNNQFKAGILNAVTENKPELPEPVIKDGQKIINEEKRKSFSDAFGDML